MTLAHTVAPQNNEVEGALKLPELISLKGCIVTGDGLHCPFWSQSTALPPRNLLFKCGNG
jgi:hypothetical protein